MSRAISRSKVMNACIHAVKVAEDRYSKWNGVMRAAPESLVQAVVAEKIAKLGDPLLLEASVKTIIELATRKPAGRIPGKPNGRVDIATYFKSGRPRFLIEVKKVTGKKSLNKDKGRILKLLKICPRIQNGFLVGYATRADAGGAVSLLNLAKKETNSKIYRRLDPMLLKSRRTGKDIYLAAAIYRVDRKKKV